MMKTVLTLVLVLSSVCFAEDVYRKMVFSNVSQEEAKAFNPSVPGVVLSLSEYDHAKKKLTYYYAVKGTETPEARQSVRDLIKTAAAKEPDEFVTIQKGEKLTTAADLK